MRITGGSLKSRRIDKKLPSGIRPTTDQSRETLFNILNNLIELEGSKFLDLFAGSGIVSLEASSRGAIVTAVDKSFKSTSYIKDVLSILKIDNINIIKSDAINYLNSKEKFDIIFIDPPYDTMLYEKALSSIKENEILNEDGLVVLESRSSRNIDVSGFDLIKEKEIGSYKFIFLELP